MGDEPVWAKVGDMDVTSVDEPQSYGATRFDASGNSITAPHPQVDGDWRVVGWVTSGGYGHFVQASFAQAYIPTTLSDRTDENFFEIEVLGERRPAKIALQPLFDPLGEKMRS